MSQLQALRAAVSLHDVATLLDFEPKYLAYIVRKMPDAAKYQSFQIAKRSGGFRQINAPCAQLKLLQRKLSNLLQNCLAEINSTRKLADNLAHGFKRNRSIIDNAVRHKNKRFVFNIDLQDFFDTVNFGRVRGFFIKNAHFMLASDVATILAQIACYGKGLPQGSPCSPVISNLVGHILDIRLCKVAFKNGCTYSRYADDITFSTNRPNFPPDIAAQISGTTHKWQPGTPLQKIIIKAGFSINPDKTRMQYQGSRQAVTGLVVNKKVNTRNEYRRTARAMAQKLFTTGQFEFVKMIPDANGVLAPTKTVGNLNQLHGIFGHIDFIDRHNQEILAKRDSGSKQAKALAGAFLRSKQKVYRRFLLFKDFYAAERPVVLCEGKTDNVYLFQAIKSLAVNYPQLAMVSPGNKIAVAIRILKTLDSSIGKTLLLGHGASDLVHLLEQYLSALHKFKAPGMQKPVILLVDNDSGADEVLKAIKRLTGRTMKRTDPYFRVAGNIYVVLTPLKENGGESEIEDCFDDTIKNLNLGGKVFSPDNKADPALYFGKSILAQYIRENSGKINFRGFAKVLDRIVAVINDFDSALTQVSTAADASAT